MHIQQICYISNNIQTSIDLKGLFGHTVDFDNMNIII